MKKTTPSFLLAVVTVLVLATSGLAVAQSDMGNTPTTGATFTTGIVESFGDNSVTIKKDSGESVTLMLEAATVGKANLVNGNRVRIDYRTDDKGQTIAQEIEINGEATVAAAPAYEAPKVEVDTQVAVAEPAPAPATTYTAPAAPVEPAPAAPAAPMTTETVDTTVDTEPDALPATASRMPAFALLGLLALAGGLAIRLVR